MYTHIDICTCVYVYLYGTMLRCVGVGSWGSTYAMLTTRFLVLTCALGVQAFTLSGISADAVHFTLRVGADSGFSVPALGTI